MQSLDRLLGKTLKQNKTKPYDTVATVTRVEANTAWVHIPGGITETPVERTIDCKPKDTVKVRVSGGRAWITGNTSSPPTDDTEAKAAHVTAKAALAKAKDALKKLNYFWTDDDGAHITRTDETEFKQRPEGGNVLINSDGVYLRDGTADVAHFEKTNISMRNETGQPVFYIGSDNGTGLTWIQTATGTSANLDFEPVGNVTVTTLWTDLHDHEYETFVFAAPGTDTGHHGRITYDGHSVTTSGMELSKIVYETGAAPYFTLGSRTGTAGAFSAAIGDGLIAPKGLVIGQFNESDPDGLLIIGDGHDDGNRHNLLTVTDTGITIDCPVTIDGYETWIETVGTVDWQIRKYPNGIVEAFGWISSGSTTYAGTAWGQLYYTDITVTWPDVFARTPANIQATSNNGQWAALGITAADATECTLRAIKPVSSAQSYKFYIHAIQYER